MKNSKLIFCGCVATAMLSTAAGNITAGKNSTMDNIYDVTGKRELFIDDFLIESKRGIAIKQHAPVELPSNPDKPIGHYNTILQKPDGTYLCYFRGVDNVYKGKMYNNHPGEYVGVSTSKDGVKWEAPDYKLFPGKPVPGNAILYGGNGITHNFVPFYDTNPECKASERYKAVAGVRETRGLFAYCSADGINWKMYGTAPVIKYEPEKTGGHMLDSQNAVFYSQEEKCYVMYIRVWKTADNLKGLRSIAKVVSKDFINWSEPEFLKMNRKGEHIYVSGLTPYFRAPHYYAGAATRYFGNRGSATDVVLLFSRSGKGIIRPSCEAWIRPGLDPERWLNRMNYLSLGIVRESPETMLLYHNRKKLMYRLRTDGFASLNAGITTGTVLTKVLSRRGGNVEFNIATSAGGGFQVEVCDENGNALPGYRFTDMKEFYGDKIAFVPQWKGGRSLADLPAGKFRLRLHLKECDLYSVAFPEK
ncbi:MAG: hypothetical protein IJY46_09165 [Lentisphaeria bacterium]|nr:hypothetical protein [Lentisphaeria bacterium]